jgi:hypothetical protein
VIHVQTDGSKPGFNFIGGMDPILQVFIGYRWAKWGTFVRFFASGPQGDWFNLAIGFQPSYAKTADAVHCFEVLLTVRCILTISLAYQLRFGVRSPEAVATYIKKIMDDMALQGRKPVMVDQTGDDTLSKAVSDIQENTPSSDKKKLN